MSSYSHSTTEENITLTGSALSETHVVPKTVVFPIYQLPFRWNPSFELCLSWNSYTEGEPRLPSPAGTLSFSLQLSEAPLSTQRSDTDMHTASGVFFAMILQTQGTLWQGLSKGSAKGPKNAILNSESPVALSHNAYIHWFEYMKLLAVIYSLIGMKFQLWIT